MSHHRIIAATTTVAVALGLGACGSSDDNGSSTAPAASTPAPASTTTAAVAPPATTAASGGRITVTATDYAFKPTAFTAAAGTVRVTLDNQGKLPHEFVLLKTATAPGALKVDKKTARVSESASVGEVSEIDAGKSAATTFHLKPGKYVYVCNIPAHYGLGMHGLLTVR